jgi:hypothetical protein
MNENDSRARMEAALQAVQQYYPHACIALVVFLPNTLDQEGGSLVNYIGNVPQQAMLPALKTVIGHWEGTKVAGTPTRH